MVESYEKQLKEMQWAGIAFPVTNLVTNFQQQIVEHRYPDRDGAHIESTGMEPIKISATAVLYNNISPGKNETWRKGTLFPVIHDELLNAMQSRSVNELQHPMFGIMKCKPVSARSSLSAERRDGVTVDLEWIETINVEVTEKLDILVNINVINLASEIQNGLTSSTFLANLRAKGLSLPKGKNLFQMVNELTGFIDSGTLVGLKALAMANRIIHSCDQLIAAVNRLNDVLLVDLKTKIQNLKASIVSTRKALNNKLGIISTLRTSIDQTLGDIASSVSNGIVDVLRLNPQYAGKVTVPAGSIVKYYKIA